MGILYQHDSCFLLVVFLSVFWLTAHFPALQLVGRRALAFTARSLVSSVSRGDAYLLHRSSAATVQVDTDKSRSPSEDTSISVHSISGLCVQLKSYCLFISLGAICFRT